MALTQRVKRWGSQRGLGLKQPGLTYQVEVVAQHAGERRREKAPGALPLGACRPAGAGGGWRRVRRRRLGGSTVEHSCDCELIRL